MIETALNVLHMISRPVNPKAESLGLLFEQLERGLAESIRPGIGLAAIQLSIPRQAFIIKLPNKDVIKIWNPEIMEWGEEEILIGEGCLSLPATFNRSVARKTELTLKNGDGRTYVLEGMEAIVAQHEMAHLRGRLLIDEPIRNQKVGRNEPCSCNSGKKWKKCCGSLTKSLT